MHWLLLLLYLRSLVLILHGPMQSWGGLATTEATRPTLVYPTRSAIIGLLAAAQGFARDHELGWACQLVVTVRADRPGDRAEPDGRGDAEGRRGAYCGENEHCCEAPQATHEDMVRPIFGSRHPRFGGLPEPRF